MLVASFIVACKKRTTTLTNTVTCGDNPNINFTCNGTPIGKFGDCITDLDGNIYKTVTIGTQTWMAENLKTSKYNDGTLIPNIKDSSKWVIDSTGAWCNYRNNDSIGKKYGKLYNWYAVSPTTNGNKNVCPTGWHVPSDYEWIILSEYLGSTDIAGGKMKEIDTTSWISPNINATNISLFTAVPGGYRDLNNFVNLKYNGCWWTSTESNNNYVAFSRSISLYDGEITKDYNFEKMNGMSIRCIKD